MISRDFEAFVSPFFPSRSQQAEVWSERAEPIRGPRHQHECGIKVYRSTDRMDRRLSCGSPREDGELEDGEICDDEAEEKQQQKRQGARPGPGSRRPKTSTPRPKPAAMGPGKDFRPPPPPFRAGGALHGPFPGCAPTDRLEPPSPRSSFWERSHGALSRLRYRGRPGEGRGDRARAAGRGRNLHRKDSPSWKRILYSRAVEPLCQGGTRTSGQPEPAALKLTVGV